MQLRINHKGFTLIETLIYIALMAIMIGGGLIGVFNIIEGTGRTRDAMHREQEAFFITRKIDMVLNGASVVFTPANGATENELVIRMPGNEDVRINLSGGQIFLQRDGGAEQPLHDTIITADNLSFTHDGDTLTAQFELEGIPYALNHYLP